MNCCCTKQISKVTDVLILQILRSKWRLHYIYTSAIPSFVDPGEQSHVCKIQYLFIWDLLTWWRWPRVIQDNLCFVDRHNNVFADTCNSMKGTREWRHMKINHSCGGACPASIFKKHHNHFKNPDCHKTLNVVVISACRQHWSQNQDPRPIQLHQICRDWFLAESSLKTREYWRRQHSPFDN